MVLSPIETMPLLLMRFTSRAPPDLVLFVKERLISGGIIAATEEISEDSGIVVLGLTTTQEELEAEAEHVKLGKPIRVGCSPFSKEGEETSNVVMEYFTVDARSEFLRPRFSPLSAEEEKNTDEYDSFGLFTSSDRVMLIWSMLDSIAVLEQGTLGSNLSRKLHEVMNVSHANGMFSKKRRSPDAGELQKKCLWLMLRENDLCDLISPVHVPHIREKILMETLELATGPPTRAMRDYYGEEVSFYFAWMGHFTRWLIVPGLFGLGISVARTRMGYSEDTCQLTPFHGLITFIWAVLSLRFWDREESRLAYEWGTFSATGYEKKYFNVRPEFRGEPRISPVTGMTEKYYPSYKRRLKYIVSALVTMVLLAGAFFVMILSLNLQGYVRPRDDRERWYEDHDHPFHYPFLSTLAEEGNLFDAASQWRCYVPVILHVCVVMTMNMGYREIAEKLTEWENHETEIGHENSLILKRFLFEAFDAYIVLFYLAFYEKDMEKLRGELVSLFNVDTFRRLLVECGLPMVLQWRSSGKTKYFYGDKKKTEGEAGTYYAPLTEEASRDPYEEFDDYLEMIIQLGYVTLFASAYPLAAFVAIFANFIEIRTDVMKLTKVCLRPRPHRTDSIGTWKLLIKSIIWLSALTNCLIFGFSSKQLLQWLPNYFYLDDFGQHKMVDGKGRYIAFIIFAIEHTLILIALIINLVIPKVSEDVIIKEQRRQFVRLQSTQKLRITETVKKQRSLGMVKFRKPKVFKILKSAKNK